MEVAWKLEQSEIKILCWQVEIHDDHKAKTGQSQKIGMMLKETHTKINGTCATKGLSQTTKWGPNEDYKLVLHKYKRDASSIAIYWWATRFAKFVPHLQVFHRALRFLFYKALVACFSLFLFLLSLFFSLFSFFFFSLFFTCPFVPTTIQDHYMR